jgi:hypothetical protein
VLIVEFWSYVGDPFYNEGLVVCIEKEIIDDCFLFQDVLSLIMKLGCYQL